MRHRLCHSAQYTYDGIDDVTGELSWTSAVGHQKLGKHNVLGFLPPEQPEKSIRLCSSCEGLSFDPGIEQACQGIIHEKGSEDAKSKWKAEHFWQHLFSFFY